MRRGLGCGCGASAPAGLGGVMDSVGVPVLLFVGLFGVAGYAAYAYWQKQMKGA
jgi:hypothetical protein